MQQNEILENENLEANYFFIYSVSQVLISNHLTFTGKLIMVFEN